MARGSRGPRSRGRGDDDLPSDDEMEAFHTRRLGSDADLGLEDDDGNASEDSDLNAEGVLDLKRVQYNDDDEDSDDDSDDIDAKVDAKTAKMGKRWGSKRSDFFKEGDESDSEEISDEEEAAAEAEAEEQEARKMKRQLAKGLKAEDFELDVDSDDEDVKQAGALLVKKKKAQQQGKKKDTSRKNEKLERVAAQAPELIGLLSEFKANLETLEKHVVPVMQKVQEGEMPTENGVSYLEAKYVAMLTYCINIAYYLYLKANSESVKDHPVIRQLVRMRTVLEKLKPLDIKLKNQLDEILASKAAPVTKQASGVKKAAVKNAARPNPADLMDDDDDVSDLEEKDVGSEEDFDDDDEEVQPRSKKNKETSGAPKRYMVPKVFAPTNFEEEEREALQDEKRRKRLQRKLQNNRMLQELTSELTDRPMEEPSIGASLADRKNREEMAERTKYEEDYFVRLRETKKQRNMRRQRERDAQALEGNLADLEEFGDLEGLVSRIDRDASYRVDEKARREQELAKFMQKIEQQEQSQKKKAEKRQTGDEDLAIRDPMVLQMNKNKRAVFDEEEAMAEQELKEKKRRLAKFKRDVEMDENIVDDAEEDDMYRMAKEEAREKKRQRQEQYTIEPRMQSAPGRTLDEGKKRFASRKIMKNEGLHAHKRVEDRNPRTRRRKLYERKVKARKGQVRDVRTGEADNYGGESSGLRTNLVASRRPGK